MTGIGITRPSVLERARRGDGDEFARLYAPLCYQVARKLGLAEDSAEEVAQQAMLDLLELLPRFRYDPARGSFKGLVKKIVRNRVADFLRQPRTRAGNETLDQVADSTDSFGALFEREWQKVHLTEALARVRTDVTPSTFQSFQLCVLCEWPLRQVAVTLDLSPNQVSQNKRRVLQRLQTYFAELQHETD